MNVQVEQRGPIKFFVPGIPRPKGSTKSFWNPKAKHVVTMGDNPEQKGWQSLISLTAHEVGLRPREGCIRLDIGFLMPRCKSDYHSSGNLRPNAPPFHIKKPDLDKILRSILDALTGIAYLDDSQVNVIYCWKSFVIRQDEEPGVSITVQ